MNKEIFSYLKWVCCNVALSLLFSALYVALGAGSDFMRRDTSWFNLIWLFAFLFVMIPSYNNFTMFDTYSLCSEGQPRPTYGIRVAMMFISRTLTSVGRDAM